MIEKHYGVEVGFGNRANVDVKRLAASRIARKIHNKAVITCKATVFLGLLGLTEGCACQCLTVGDHIVVSGGKSSAEFMPGLAVVGSPDILVSSAVDDTPALEGQGVVACRSNCVGDLSETSRCAGALVKGHSVDGVKDRSVGNADLGIFGLLVKDGLYRALYVLKAVQQNKLVFFACGDSRENKTK